MIINVVSGACMAAAIIAVLIRVIYGAGLLQGNNGTLSFVLEDKRNHNSFKVNRKDLAGVFGLSFAFRIAVFIISIYAIYIFEDGDVNFKFGDFVNRYLLWDSRHYMSIAIGGYSYSVTDGDYLTLVFYPLYAWLIRFMHIFTRNYVISGLLVSWVLYSGACCFLYSLLSYDYNKSTAVRAIVFISVFPHSLFFGAMMSESLFLFNSAATLYFIRGHKWPLVGVFGAIAALSRAAGLLLAFPAAVEWLEHYEIAGKLKRKNVKEVFKLFYSKGLWIFLMLAGTGIYLYFNYKTTGEWFKFLEYEEKNWSNGFQYIGKSINTIWDYTINETKFTKYSLWLPELTAVVFAFAMLLYGIRRHRNMYSAYLIVYMILNIGMKWPISVARYMTCAVPLFITLSDFSERHRWTEPVITAVMAIAFGVFFVAYFQQKQIL